ncbi:MAG: hypothetical protein P8Y42_04135 [Exilibacterium sp.]
MQSKFGVINISIVGPLVLVMSVVPVSVNKDLSDLPRGKSWKPGDSVIERDDKKIIVPAQNSLRPY